MPSTMTDERTKRAAPGSAVEDDRGYEQAFANLAHALVRQRAPRLQQYEIGFEMLDRAEDGDRAAGAIAYKLGPELVLAPMFWIQGRLKGHELLYLRRQDLFVPLKDGWVDDVLNRRPASLGAPVPRALARRGMRAPDLGRLIHGPDKRAAAAAADAELRAEADRVRAAAHAAGVRDADRLDRMRDEFVAGYGALLKAAARRPGRAAPPLPELLARGDLADAFEGLARAVPSVLRPLVAGYGGPLRRAVAGLPAAKAAADRRRREIRVAAAAVLAGPRVPRRRPPAAAGLTLVRPADLDGPLGATKAAALGDAGRDALGRLGYALLDRRPLEKRARTLAVDEAALGESALTPEATGLYDVVVGAGAVRRCLVVLRPHLQYGRASHAILVAVDAPGRPWIALHPSRIFAVRRRDDAEYRAFVAGLPRAQPPRGDRPTLYLDPSGRDDGTVPVSADGRAVGRSIRVHFDTAAAPSSDMASRAAGGWTSSRHAMGVLRGPEYDRWEHGEYLVFSPSGTRLSSALGTLRVPEDYRALRLAATTYDADAWPRRPPHDLKWWQRQQLSLVAGNGRSDRDALLPGTLDLPGTLASLTKEAADGRLAGLRVRPRAGGGYELQLRPLGGASASTAPRPWEAVPGRAAAAWKIAAGAGLGAADAEALLDRADRSPTAGAGVVLVAPPEKRADRFEHLRVAGEDGDPGQLDPAYLDELVGDDFSGSGIPATRTEVSLLRGDRSRLEEGREAYRVSPEDHDMPWTQAAVVVEQAARTGDRDVLDIGALGAMLSVTRDDAAVDRYLPAAVRGMDALARMLVGVTWRPDIFEDRYGASDVPGIEDALRNTFEQVGDLVLQLKKRSATSLPHLVGGPDLDRSEPG